MKICLIILAAILSCKGLFCQENEHISAVLEQQSESMANQDDINQEDNDNLQLLQHFAKYPLNLNQAAKGDLVALTLLNDLQIGHLLNYRNLFGKLLSVYELQAVPGWNIETIQKILPFVQVSNHEGIFGGISKQWNGGDHKLLFRFSRVLEKAKGFTKSVDTTTGHYMGGPDKLFFRYTYNNKSRLQWGIVGDKDAGEPFFKGKQNGFDFYSFHFFTKGNGVIKALALGDYRVNMGQGLIQWQSLALNKSAEVMAVKRQSPVLSAYHAAGEHHFYRGMGITLRKNNWEGTGFISLRKLSANTGVDPLTGTVQVSSFHSSGYHRTILELEKRKNLRQFTMGATLSRSTNSWRLAANVISTLLSMPLKKADEPHNLFAGKGQSFANASIDYSYTYRNVHLFGEAAADRGMHKAILNGLLVSLNARAEASLVLRLIDRQYQSLYSNAFTENTVPVNENGLYAGITIRPSSQISINAYADTYRFPWLKYRVDAPSSGKKYLVQLTYKPNKQVEIYSRYRTGLNEENRSDDTSVTTQVDKVKRQSWRVHSSIRINTDVMLRSRCELYWFNKNRPGAEQGFLIFMDVLHKPRQKSWSASLRLLYFETEGYNARIYAYENDSPSSFSIPPFFDKGYRYYINLNGVPKKPLCKGLHIEYWLRWAQTIYPGKSSIGTGLEGIQGNRKTDVHAELLFRF